MPRQRSCPGRCEALGDIALVDGEVVADGLDGVVHQHLGQFVAQQAQAVVRDFTINALHVVVDKVQHKYPPCIAAGSMVYYTCLILAALGWYCGRCKPGAHFLDCDF